MTEEQLAHEIGDDTKVFAAAVLAYGAASLLLAVASLVLWHWPRVKKQWSADRRLLRDSR